MVPGLAHAARAGGIGGGDLAVGGTAATLGVPETLAEQGDVSRRRMGSGSALDGIWFGELESGGALSPEGGSLPFLYDEGARAR